jgi:hypothetical protein
MSSLVEIALESLAHVSGGVDGKKCVAAMVDRRKIRADLRRHAAGSDAEWEAALRNFELAGPKIEAACTGKEFTPPKTW